MCAQNFCSYAPHEMWSSCACDAVTDGTYAVLKLANNSTRYSHTPDSSVRHVNWCFAHANLHSQAPTGPHAKMTIVCKSYSRQGWLCLRHRSNRSTRCPFVTQRPSQRTMVTNISMLGNASKDGAIATNMLLWSEFLHYWENVTQGALYAPNSKKLVP